MPQASGYIYRNVEYTPYPLQDRRGGVTQPPSPPSVGVDLARLARPYQVRLHSLGIRPLDKICTKEAAAGLRLDSQLSAPRRCWNICGAGPPTKATASDVCIFPSRDIHLSSIYLCIFMFRYVGKPGFATSGHPGNAQENRKKNK